MARRRRRRNHLVPDFYLKRFADEAGRIAVFPLDSSRSPFVTGTAGVAVEIDFYTIETPEGPSDELESIISDDIEGPAAEAMRQLRQEDWPPTYEVRAAMAHFLTLQLLRGRRFRDLVENVSETTARQILELLGSNPEGLRRSYLQAMGEEPSGETLTELAAFLSHPDRYTITTSSQPGNRNVMNCTLGEGTRCQVI